MFRKVLAPLFCVLMVIPGVTFADSNIPTTTTPGITTLIDANGYLEARPKIYGNNIVWEDWYNGGINLKTENLSTGEKTLLDNFGSYPWIYGDKIVWQDSNLYPLSGLWVYDL